MTYADEERLDTLKYRLLSPSEDIGSWGHEYMRHLALEIGLEYQNRLNDEKPTDDLTELALSLVPFFLSHNAEADAVDILSEFSESGMIERIVDYVDENTYKRVCLYIVRCDYQNYNEYLICLLMAAVWYLFSPPKTRNSYKPHTIYTKSIMNIHTQWFSL